MIASLLLGRRKRAALAVLLGVATIAAGLGLLATSGYLISKAALQPPILTLTVAIVGVRFFGVARAVLRYLERLVSHDLAFRLLTDARVRFYRRLVPFAPGGLRLRSGDLLSRYVSDVDSLQHVFVRGLAPPLVAAGAIVTALVVAVLVLPVGAAVLAVGLLAAATAVPLVGLVVARSSRRRLGPARGELTAELVELLRGAPELVAYGRADAQRDRVLASDRRLGRLAVRDSAVGGLTGGLGLLASAMTVVAVVAVGAAAVHDGTFGGVYLAVLAFVVLASFEAVANLPTAARELGSAASVVRRLEETGAGPVPVDPPRPRPAARARIVTVEGACVRHDDHRALDRVDLTLAPGRRVALVGPSGSGKTTLAHALVRFRDVDEGRVTLNGHDAREYAQADIRREILLSSEEAYLFAASIRDNVRLARPDASDAEVARALERAGAWDWVSSLPDGLDTFVGEDGGLVSGGQRQRLALARALLAEATILILDEPTAHLDAASAAAFVEDLVAATEDRGLLLITHRLTGLDRFDEIVVLDGGRVVERGTERELLARGGRYAELAQPAV